MYMYIFRGTKNLRLYGIMPVVLLIFEVMWAIWYFHERFSLISTHSYLTEFLHSKEMYELLCWSNTIKLTSCVYCFIIILPKNTKYTYKILKKDEARESKEANKACV